jgi:hypothetical protein
VDSTGAVVTWITGATLTGNICTFNVDTSTVRSSSIVYINVTSTISSATSILSRPISI